MVRLTVLIVLVASLPAGLPAARGDEPADLARRSGEDWGAFLRNVGITPRRHRLPLLKVDLKIAIWKFR